MATLTTERPATLRAEAIDDAGRYLERFLGHPISPCWYAVGHWNGNHKLGALEFPFHNDPACPPTSAEVEHRSARLAWRGFHNRHDLTLVFAWHSQQAKQLYCGAA